MGGRKLVSVLAACKEKCCKASWYDFGLRFIKNVVKEIGEVGRRSGFQDETKLVADCLGTLLYMRSTAADKQIIFSEMKNVFAVDLELPEGFKSSTIEGVTRMVVRAQQRRHGICVVGTT